MPYPDGLRSQNDYLIPWINRMNDGSMDEQQFSQWAYFLGFIIVPEKVNSLYIDFFIIFLVYIYYQTCQFWLIPESFETVISKDTE
jgi:hypothetical protein